MYVLNLSHKTSKFRIITKFVIVDLQTVFYMYVSDLSLYQISHA
jgi:hypothetical protein